MALKKTQQIITDGFLWTAEIKIDKYFLETHEKIFYFLIYAVLNITSVWYIFLIKSCCTQNLVVGKREHCVWRKKFTVSPINVSTVY